MLAHVRLFLAQYQLSGKAMRQRPATLVVCLLLTCFASNAVFGQTREEKVRNDLKKVTEDGFWIYNDIPKAFAEAKRSGKPIVVVLRCIPCEECVKLDDDLVDTDPVVRPLLEKFVCVRQVSTNGLDLSLFQYDTDQSFAVFFLNADGTIYGRFGTRSHRTEWVQDVSLTGLAAALCGALALHEDYPNNQASLAGKRGPKPLFPSPEKFPALKDKFTDSLNYKGNVVKSCIHCHQIGDAMRDYYRAQSKPIPEEILFPYPHPKTVGITLDPETASSIKSIAPDSAADEAGFLMGDVIVALNGQPILSSADVQWVLHNTSPSGGNVAAIVKRNGNDVALKLQLDDGWRRKDDITWRVSSWGLCRMSTGGLRCDPLPEERRKQLKIEDGKMALLIRVAGRYNAHAAARKAGFQEGDIIISVDGRTDLLTYGVTERKPGDRVPAIVLRNGREKRLMLPMQK